MDRRDPPLRFWRCRACGTPNPWRDYVRSCLGCGSERPVAPDPILPSVGPRRGRLIGAAAWGYAGAVAALLLVLRLGGDRFWAATLLLYAPRWPFALPLVVLVPTALIRRRRSLIPLALASVLMIGPILGLCVPWRHLLRREPAGSRLRVMTCNVQSGHWDPARLGAAVAEADPDILLLQEWSEFPAAPPAWSAGRHVRRDGGLYVSSRYPFRSTEVLRDPVAPWRTIAARYDVDAPSGPIRVFNVHLETPRKGIEPVLHGGVAGVEELNFNTASRDAESARVARWVGEARGRVLVGGDFNLPPDGVIFARYWGRFTDAFADSGWGLGYTKSTRWHGLRIDHVLSDYGRRGFNPCWVGPDVGSDHRPIVAEWAD